MPVSVTSAIKTVRAMIIFFKYFNLSKITLITENGIKLIRFCRQIKFIDTLNNLLSYFKFYTFVAVKI